MSGLFVHPVQMGMNHIFLVVPLCFVVGIVYKTIRVNNLRQLPLQVLGLWAYMLAGLSILGIAFFLLLEYVA